MPATLPPGIGTDQQALQATAFVREQPWYMDWLAQRGIKQGPNQQVKLTDDQALELNQLIRAHGVGMNTRYDGIDENGMIVEEHHKLKKAAIAAAIGGLALTGFGAAGIGPLAGTLGGASAAGAAGGAAAATIPTTAGIASATALGLPVTAGLGSAGAIGAGAAGAAGAGTLASTQLGTGAIGPVSGGTGLAGGSTSIAGGIGGAAKSYFSDPKNWLDIANQTGDLFSANAAGRAQGRVQEAGVTQAQDRNAIALYQALLNNNQAENNFGINRGTLAGNNARIDLDQRQFKLDAPGKRAGNSVRGDILSRAQDVNISGVSPNIPVPTISGGLRPSMFSPNTRALGENMTAQALSEQQAGDTFAPLPALPDWKTPPAPPTLTPTPEANGLDTALTTGGNILGLAGGIGSTFLDYYNRYKGKQLPKTTVGGTTSGDWLSGQYS